VARFLIVGCGCRGRALAEELIAGGHAVRGTTRDATRTPEIEAAGAEAVVADPDRLGTVTTRLAGTTVVCWLMGSAGDAAVNAERLPALAERLVDSGVRGLVVEAVGTAPEDALRVGADAARRAGESHRMPVEVVDADPGDHDAWLTAMRAAAGRVLAA
jgi:hypothetical protein